MSKRTTTETFDTRAEREVKDEHRSFATEELDAVTIERIAKTRMHARHQHLDELLKDG